MKFVGPFQMKFFGPHLFFWALMLAACGGEMPPSTEQLESARQDRALGGESVAAPVPFRYRPAEAQSGAAGAVVRDGTQCAGNPMTYHQGPVVHDARIHPIYWQPSTSSVFLAGVTLSNFSWNVEYFVTDMVAFPMFQTMREYPDTSGRSPSTVTHVPGSAYSAPLPHAGTVADPLQSGDVERAVDSYAATMSASTDDIYVLFLPTAVHVCLSSGQCTFPDAAGNAIGGWHSATPGGHMYAVIPSMDNLFPGAFAPAISPFPNGRPLDTTYNVLSHEIFEALTNPRGTGWFGPNSPGEPCFENGDRCTARALSFSVTGSFTLFPLQVDIQQEWSNASGSCGQTNSTINAVFPNHGPKGGGTVVTIQGANFAAGTSTSFDFLTNVGCTTTTSCTGTTIDDGSGAAATVHLAATVNGIRSLSTTADQFTFDATPACTTNIACPSVGYYVMPNLTITCPLLVDFWQAGTELAASRMAFTTTMGPYAADIQVCDSRFGLRSCSTISDTAAYGICGQLPPPPPPPPTCGGVREPAPSGCPAGEVWHCCSSRWLCGAPHAFCPR